MTTSVAIDSSKVKTSPVDSRFARIILGILLMLLALIHLEKAMEQARLLSYSLAILTFIGGVISFVSYFKGPFIKLTDEHISFKVNLRDVVHRLGWESIREIRFGHRRIFFETNKGTRPVYFNCGENNFIRIKRAIRFYAEDRGTVVVESED